MDCWLACSDTVGCRMPEGPEIRLAADRIAKVLVGKTVVDVSFSFPELRRFEKRLTGASVTAIDTLGKAMLTRFDNGLTLYSHNQLYGRWYAAKRDRIPNTGRSLRVALHTATHSAFLYSASEIEVLTAKQLERHPFLSRLGPDVLDPNLTAASIAERLENAHFRRRALGSLYLDQSFLAGIGNYLRSEILYRSKVHPAVRPMDLDRIGCRRLASKTLTISRRSYRTHGVTMPPKRVRKRKAEGLDYDQYRFWVYGREGLPCDECETPILRVAVASRGLFFCPACQAKER